MKEFRVRDVVGGWIVSYYTDKGEHMEEVFTDQGDLNSRLPELVAEMECA